MVNQLLDLNHLRHPVKIQIDHLTISQTGDLKILTGAQ